MKSMHLSTLIFTVLAGILFSGSILTGMNQKKSAEAIKADAETAKLENLYNRLKELKKAWETISPKESSLVDDEDDSDEDDLYQDDLYQDDLDDLDIVAEEAYSIIEYSAAFAKETDDAEVKKVLRTARASAKIISESIKDIITSLYEKIGYTQPSQGLKKEVYKALKACKLEDKVIFMASTARSSSHWAVHQSDWNKYHYILVYNPEATANKYANPAHIASIYHELAHIIHGDCCSKKDKKHTGKAGKKYVAAMAVGCLAATAKIYSSLKSDPQDKVLLGLDLIQSISFVVAGHGIGTLAELLIPSSVRNKEYAADLFAYKTLLKKNNIRAIIEDFLFFIEDYENNKVLMDKFGFEYVVPHPSSFNRARAIVDFLKEHNFDLLALPIPAQDAKQFNECLKEYFPSIYAQCIQQYEQLYA